MIRQQKLLSISSSGSTHEPFSGISLLKHLSHSASSTEIPNYRNGWRRPINRMDFDKICMAMEIGHKVCKLLLLKRSEPVYKRLFLNRKTRQIVLTKWDSNNAKTRNGSQFLDLRLIREVQTVDYKVNQMLINDKWKKDKEIKKLDAELILVITYGLGFNLNFWIVLFETKETCQLWSQGIYHLVMETKHSSHFLKVERWFQKQFHILLPSEATKISVKEMKPFIQTTLQCELESKELQELCDGEINFEAFTLAMNRLLNFEKLFNILFGEKIQTENISLDEFHQFLLEDQQDEMAENKQQIKEFLRANLREIDLQRDTLDPFLTKNEFIEFLFSQDNSIFDPINLKVVHDMNQPLTNYWIASSHNTYLTGDQLKSESALEAYSRCLLWGSRCIELDCWDGRKNKKNEPIDVVIYHGYTMTSKVTLRDVLFTIRHYAFITSDFPVILSIEDRCSVPFQRLMAIDFQEILGDLLVTTPVSKDETCLPSPAALRNRIILKHKKLPCEAEILTGQQFDDEDSDILYKNCVKKGILSLLNNTNYEWTKHVFILFADKLCYISTCLENGTTIEEFLASEDTETDESNPIGFGIQSEELHVTEEWFHGRINIHTAEARLMEHKENGMFLIRESGTFIGDYTLSFYHGKKVRHVHIKTALIKKQKQYFFHSNLTKETLYELISFYTKHFLPFEKFKVQFLIPCPQPQPHLNQPWFTATANKERAEEILNAVNEDGAFLIRHSSTDSKVFVLSLRTDGEIWHYRLKRDGRIFVVNQTVFENLNQIVEYYSNHDFIPGIFLKIPVNEKDLIEISEKENLPGTYKDINYLDKEIEALTLKPYESDDPNALNFPANVIIKIIKKNSDFWKGKYDNQIGFFPPEYVTNVPKTFEMLNYETIELFGTIVEKWKTNKSNAIRIVCPTGQWASNEWIIAAEDSDDMQDWFVKMLEISKNATKQIHDMRKKENDLKIASELSNLVVYCQARPFDPNFLTKSKFYEMCSYPETKQEKLIEKGLFHFNIQHLSRSYPMGTRVTSTNYMPIPMWNYGCQMVALNYQTGDKPMQLNQGKFIANGKCGYILKPSYLLNKNSDPTNLETIKDNFPIILKLTIIGGRQLSSKDKNKGICSPFVEIEIHGFKFDQNVDDKIERKRTSTVSSNGLNPLWQETFSFTINCPEMALIRFNVEDGDFLGAKSDPFIGQAVFPVDCLRNGFRSVRLLNQFSEPHELSSLLVHVEIFKAGDVTNQRISNPHQKLQNGRSVYSQWNPATVARSISSTSTGFADSFESSPLLSPSPTSPSSNQRMVFPINSPNTDSADSSTNNKKSSALRKTFKMKK